MLREHPDELRADLRQVYGVDLDRARAGLHSAAHVAALARQLPGDARVRVAADADAAWTRELCLLGVVDAVMGVIGFVQEWWPTISDIIGSVMEGVVGFMQEAWPVISDIVSTVSEAVMQVISTAWPVVSAVIGTVMDVILGVIQTVWPVISGIVTGAVDVISGAIEGMSWLIGAVGSTFDGIRRAIEDPIGTAKSLVHDAIEAIKGFFSFNIEWPHIPLPHFYANGSINPLDWITQCRR